MIPVVIASCRCFASCSPVSSFCLSRRVASSPPKHLSLSVVLSLSRRSLPPLALHCCRVAIAPCPTVFGWLLCLFPLPLAVAVSCVALRCVVSPHTLGCCCLPSPNCCVVASNRAHPSHCCLLLHCIVSPCCLAITVSCAALLRLPSCVSSLLMPSSSHCVVAALPHLSFSVVIGGFIRVRYPLQ